MRMQLRTLHKVLGVFSEMKRNSPECLQNKEGMRVEKRKEEKDKRCRKQPGADIKLYVTMMTV